MTDEEAAAIQARAEAATPGPWKWQPFDSIIAPSVGLYVVKGSGSGVVDDDDAVFIAQAREAIPALLAERAALVEIARAVATADTLAYENDAGDDQRCVFCYGANDEHGLPTYQLVKHFRKWKHTPDCPVTKARALLGIQPEA